MKTAIMLAMLLVGCGGTQAEMTGEDEPKTDGGATDGATTLAAKGDTAPIMAACDKQMIHTSTSSTGQVITQTTFLADIDVPGVSPTAAQHIDVTICDLEYFGTSRAWYAPSCPSGATCTNSGYSLTESTAPCQQASAIIGTNKIIVGCGNRTVVSGTSGFDNGQRAKTVYVRMN